MSEVNIGQLRWTLTCEHHPGYSPAFMCNCLYAKQRQPAAGCSLVSIFSSNRKRIKVFPKMSNSCFKSLFSFVTTLLKNTYKLIRVINIDICFWFNNNKVFNEAQRFCILCLCALSVRCRKLFGCPDWSYFSAAARNLCQLPSQLHQWCYWLPC